MSWFQLDASSIAARVQAAEYAVPVPSSAESLVRGVVGFTLVSVAGFAPWALGGRWFYRAIGEAGLYAVCALVFIGLSGLLLHRLIIGPGSLGRFYRLFGIAFAGYSAAWIAGWLGLGGHGGSLAGLALGTAVMAWIFAAAFGVAGSWLKIFAALFILNAAGYFAGGWADAAVAASGKLHLGGFVAERRTMRIMAHLLWGVCYGIGFGAGLGIAFYLCQADARALLAGRKGRAPAF